jgi:arginine decarboxylase
MARRPLGRESLPSSLLGELPRAGGMVPRRVFLTRGAAVHTEKLASFEGALRAAGISQFNLVSVSSILPPHCQVVPKSRGLTYLRPGEIVFCVLVKEQVHEPHRLVAASVGLAIPRDRSQYGYLSEFHGFGMQEKKAGDYAEDLAAEMLAQSLGVDFDPDSSYDERREVWKISGKIVRTANITQTAVGDRRGRWSTVVTAAVFVP